MGTFGGKLRKFENCRLRFVGAAFLICSLPLGPIGEFEIMENDDENSELKISQIHKVV